VIQNPFILRRRFDSMIRSLYATIAFLTATTAFAADGASQGPPPVEISGVVDTRVTNVVDVAVDEPVEARVVNTLPLDKIFSLGFVDPDPVLGDAPVVELPVGKYLIHDITLNLVASEDSICRGFASLLYPEDGDTLALTLAISIAGDEPQSYVRNFTPPLELDVFEGDRTRIRLGFTALTECDFIGTNILMEVVTAE
jgi:hypothetical protein